MKREAEPVQITRIDGGATVRVSGPLTMHTATAALEAAANVLASGGDEVLVFDLAEVDAADSAALAVLLEWLRRAARKGRQLVYRNVPDRIRQIARISDLEEILMPDLVPTDR